VGMHRIDLNLFDRVKMTFPSDRHELRRTAINYHYIKREYLDWKSELDLPKKYSSPEMELYYLAVTTAFQHFESSLDFSQGLEYLLEEKRANIMPAICILLRQALESAFTANYLCNDSKIRSLAQRGYKIAVRDLNNQTALAQKMQEYDSMNYNLKFLNVSSLMKQKMHLLKIGNKLGFGGQDVNEIYNPWITKLFKNISIGGEIYNLSWAYMMLSSIGHGTWLGFYPSEKDISRLLTIKDASLRVTLNLLKARTATILSNPQI